MNKKCDICNKEDSELEQIAKQVSLLNRLIELLVMQEEPTPKLIEEYGWLYCNGVQKSDTTYYLPGVRDDKGLLLMLGVSEAWNHPITQKAWSDELVRVVRELIRIREVKSLKILDTIITILIVCIIIATLSPLRCSQVYKWWDAKEECVLWLGSGMVRWTCD